MTEPLMNPKGEWAIVRPKLEARIKELRDDLEDGRGDVEHIRGEIAGLRWFQKQIEPELPLSEPTSYFS